MDKNQKRLVMIVALFQLLTAAIHSTSYFMSPSANNEQERQFLDLFQNYKTDMGAGFVRTNADIFLSLSIAFTLFFIFSGLLNIVLIKNKANPLVMRSTMALQVIIYGALFMAMFFYAFLLPVVCTGLILLSCITAWQALRQKKSEFREKVRVTNT